MTKEKEFNISEAMVIWNKRLADDCIHRIASGCRHTLGKGQCNIILCPILREAKIQTIYKFRIGGLK